MKKFIIILITCFLLFLLTNPITQFLSQLIFQSSSFITFHNPYIGMMKYTVLILVLSLLLFRYLHLTPLGKRLLPVIAILFALLSLGIFVHFNATDEKQIVQQQLWKKDIHSWNDVDYIETKAESKSTIKRIGSTNDELKLAYTIHFTDGSSLNVWDDIPSLYNLHQKVEQMGIKVKHQEVSPSVLENPNHYIEGNPDMIREILGSK